MSKITAIWLETISLGIRINLVFWPWNRNQLKKLESESIFLEPGGIPGIQLESNYFFGLESESDYPLR